MRAIFFIILLGGLFGAKQTFAQNEMFKALFMYNFTKNIEWPATYKQGDFVIGILGNSLIVAELKRIAVKKMTGNQPIKVVRFSSVGDIDKCNIIYIPPKSSGKLQDVISKLKGQPTVIITDHAGLAKKGSCINYITVNGDQKFELNKTNIIKRGLKVTSFLLSLSVKIK